MLRLTSRTADRGIRRVQIVLAILGCVVGSFGATTPASGSTRGAVAHVESVRLLERAVFDRINDIRRGLALPTGTFTVSYASIVTKAAREQLDPIAPLGRGVVVWYGIWGIVPVAPGSEDAIQLVDDWVYRDGWLGARTENRDCTSPNAPGCDSHRRAILSSRPNPSAHLFIVVGAVTTSRDGFNGESIAALLVWIDPGSG